MTSGGHSSSITIAFGSGSIRSIAAHSSRPARTENDGNFQVFIADRGKEAHVLCRQAGQGESDWYDLGEMKNAE